MINKYKNMRILDLCSMNELYEIIDDELSKLKSDFDNIAVCAKQDLINEIFVYMISNGYEIGYIDFDMLDHLLKNTVYIMSIRKNSVISIEPAYCCNEYDDCCIKGHDAASALIFMDDCKQDIIDYCLNSNKNVILFDFNAEDDEYDSPECDQCAQCNIDRYVDYSKDEDGDLHGFTASKGDDNSFMSYSLYTSNKLSLRDIQSLLQEVGF